MDAPFPDGPWHGFYVYSGLDERHVMGLVLSFRDGVVSGTGDDDIGPFTIRGKYDPGTLEIHWTKSYIGRHSVYYAGFGEPNRIWGTWELASGFRGGFKIWPKAGGQGVVQEAEIVEPVDIDVPAVAVPDRGGSRAGPLDCGAAGADA